MCKSSSLGYTHLPMLQQLSSCTRSCRVKERYCIIYLFCYIYICEVTINHLWNSDIVSFIYLFLEEAGKKGEETLSEIYRAKTLIKTKEHTSIFSIMWR
jgi:hypothetical protein